MVRASICVAAGLLAGCATPAERSNAPGVATRAPTAPAGVLASTDRPPSPEVGVAQETASSPPLSTRILDQDAALRLRANSGITLQWISWEKRGSVDLQQDGGVMTLRGTQNAQGGEGKLLVEGTVTEIGSDYFILDGLVSIVDTPDEGRLCRQRRTNWRFAVTQDRKYWRLREFEWCDLLTDYVDIYF